VFHIETKCSFCFYRKSTGQVVTESPQLLPARIWFYGETKFPPPIGRLVGLLPATHEPAKRSPLAQRDDGAAVQSQPVHFHCSGFTANLSFASAEIAQL
jgi:hypothetical protein